MADIKVIVCDFENVLCIHPNGVELPKSVAATTIMVKDRMRFNGCEGTLVMHTLIKYALHSDIDVWSLCVSDTSFIVPYAQSWLDDNYGRFPLVSISSHTDVSDALQQIANLSDIDPSEILYISASQEQLDATSTSGFNTLSFSWINENPEDCIIYPEVVDVVCEYLSTMPDNDCIIEAIQHGDADATFVMTVFVKEVGREKGFNYEAYKQGEDDP